MRGLAAWAALAIVVVSPAHAEDLAAAREHYKKGTTAYEVGQYEEAAREFTEAYKAKDDPVILFNLAQAHRLAGHTTEAIRAYRMYLLKVPGAPNRAEVQRIVDELQQRGAPKPGAVDDPDSELAKRRFAAGAAHYEAGRYEEAIKEFELAKMVKPAPALEFNIGRAHDRLGHVEEAILAYERYLASNPDDAAEIRERVEVLKQRREAVKPARPATAVEPIKPVDRSAGRTKKIAGFAVALVGVGAVAAGIALGVLAKQASDDLTKLSSSGGTFDASKERNGELFDKLGPAFIGIGGAAVVAGVVVAALGYREANKARAAASLTPSLTRDSAGLVLSLEF